jgi:hypothetical protein
MPSESDEVKEVQMKGKWINVAPTALVAVLAVFLFIPFCVTPLAAQQLPAAETFERTIPLAPGETFSLVNVNGSVEIESWGREEAQIMASKHAAGDPADLRRVRIEITQTPGGVLVQTRYPEVSGVDVRVDFRIRVPAPVRLGVVSTVNGSVVARNISGSGNLAAVNGNIVVARAAGAFSARATNGDVSLEFTSLDGGLAPDDGRPTSYAGSRISAETVNGSVEVALPPDAGAELDARTRNGDFSTELPLLSRGSSVGRTIRGRLGPGGPVLLLRTVNGSIRLRMAQPLV